MRRARVTEAAARLVRDHPLFVVALTLLVTVGHGAAIVLFPTVASNQDFDDENPVVAAERRAEDALRSRFFPVPMLLRGHDGNILTKAQLQDVLDAEAAVRRDPFLGGYVYAYESPDLQMTVSSVWSLPDTVRAVMDLETPLSYAVGWHPAVGGPGTSWENATEADVQDVLGRLFVLEDEDGVRGFRRGASADLHEDPSGAWRARSIIVVHGYDDHLVMRDHVDDPAAATPERPYVEDFQLRAYGTFAANVTTADVHGVGIGIDQEIAEEVAASGRLVAVAFLVMTASLFVFLRGNWRDFLVAASTLPLLIVWMLGWASVLGLSSNQFTAMLPVLILALGVDFAIHGIRRYREERSLDHPPGEAASRVVRLLGPALVLAAATTSVAFFSNAASGIKALRDWGIEGGLAIVSALWLMGVFAPSLRLLWDVRREGRGRLPATPRGGPGAHRHGLMGAVGAWSGRHPVLVLGVAAVVTAPAAWAAVGIETTFDADDFFDSESDFMRGVQYVEEDFPREGEPAALLIEGPVDDPRVLDALAAGAPRLRERGYAPDVTFSVLGIVQTAMRHPDDNDAHYEDADGNLVPDAAADVRRLLTRAMSEGVDATTTVEVPARNPVDPSLPPLPGSGSERVNVTGLAYDPDTVTRLVHARGDGTFDMAIFVVGIPNTSDFAVLPQARENMRADLAELWSLEESGLTLTVMGEPFKRYEMVQAVTESLKTSMAVSIGLCFLVIWAAVRRLALAAVTMVPVLLLVAWLYGFMALVDIPLNVVTATIAAMSIGVGVDYSIHITQRYLEESEHGERPAALRRALDASGGALAGSATTTVLGFLVLMLAPMPLFATFGQLTAAMAAMALVGALVVLPPLLLLATRARGSA